MEDQIAVAVLCGGDPALIMEPERPLCSLLFLFPPRGGLYDGWITGVEGSFVLVEPFGHPLHCEIHDVAADQPGDFAGL